MAPGTEFAHDFCAGIGPLQLGVVLVIIIIHMNVLFFSFFSVQQTSVEKNSLYNKGILDKTFFSQNMM